MKNIIYKSLVSSLILIGLSACELRDELKGHTGLEENEGYMELSLATKSNGEVIATKAEINGIFDAEDVNPENYMLKVTNAETGADVEEISYKNLVAQGGRLTLKEGKYNVDAYNYDGANVDASLKPYFKGSNTFSITSGGSTKVTTSCTLQNIEVGVKLADNFLTSFKDDYEITVSNGESGNWIFTKSNISKCIYFKVPDTAVKTLVADIKATTVTGEAVVSQAIISKPADAEGGTDLKAGDSFAITLNPGSDPVTKYNLSISVDLTMNETGVTIEIPTENIVYNENSGGDTTGGINFVNDNQEVTLPASYTLAEATTKAVVVINVSKGIQNLYVTINSNNEGFNSTIAGFGLSAEFDIANPGDLLPILSSPIETGEGIGLIDADKPIKGEVSYTFDVKEFMALLGLYGTGTYTFSIRVSDGTEEKGGDLIVTAE